MKIEVAAFDWNGTLLDDLKFTVEAANAVLKALHYPSITRQRYREVYDVPAVKIYKALGIPVEDGDIDLAHYAELWHQVYKPLAASAPARRYAKETFHALRKLAVRSMVWTNYEAREVGPHLERLELAEYVESVEGNKKIDMVNFCGKRARLEAYIDAHKGLDPRAIMIIADTTEEIIVGHKLGARTVAITGGYHTEERLRAAEPNFVINELNELPAIVQGLATAA